MSRHRWFRFWQERTAGMISKKTPGSESARGTMKHISTGFDRSFFERISDCWSLFSDWKIVLFLGNLIPGIWCWSRGHRNETGYWPSCFIDTSFFLMIRVLVLRIHSVDQQLERGNQIRGYAWMIYESIDIVWRFWFLGTTAWHL